MTDGKFHASKPVLYKAIAPVLAILFLMWNAIVIFDSGIEPVWDQAFVLHRFQDGYPLLDQGVTSRLVASLINLVEFPDISRLNSTARAIISTAYLGSAFLFAWRYFKLKRIAWGFPLFFAILVLSPFRLLWLSSELIAGAFLFLTLFFVLDGRSWIPACFFAAAYSLAKPDLIFSGPALAIFISFGGQMKLRQGGVRLAVFLLILFLIMLPGILSYGFGYFDDQGRSLISFGQHYASLVSRHQIVPAPDPWGRYDVYLAANFGGGGTVLELILFAPQKYLDFMALSLAVSFQNLVASGMAAPLAVALAGFYRTRARELKYALLFFAINLIPVTILSYLHVRYQAKLFPLVLAAAIHAFSLAGSRLRIFSGAMFFLLLTFEVVLTLSLLPLGYWFPD